MAEGVVDNLEVVDIEEQDREAGLPPVRELHAVGQVLPEEGAVGQAGQLVVERSAAELPRCDRELGRSVSDPPLDLAEGSFEFLAEEVHAGCDGINDVPVRTDQGAGLEPERGELLDGARNVFQTSLETPNWRVDSARRCRGRARPRHRRAESTRQFGVSRDVWKTSRAPSRSSPRSGSRPAP